MDVEGLSEKPEDYSSEDDDRRPVSPSKAHTILLPGARRCRMDQGRPCPASNICFLVCLKSGVACMLSMNAGAGC